LQPTDCFELELGLQSTRHVKTLKTLQANAWPIVETEHEDWSHLESMGLRGESLHYGFNFNL
jgi:hypothetical protein